MKIEELENIEYNSLEIRLFGNDEVNSVSLRELYLDLGYDEVNFTTWCKANLIEDFEDGIDFISFYLKKEIKIQGRQKKDYLITLDTAKELAMMSRKPKGKLIRKYFIEVEKAARQELQMTPLQMAQKANEMYEIELQETARRLAFNKKVMKGQDVVIQNIADDLDEEEVDMTVWCQLLTSRATDTYLGRTTVYKLLRLMKLVRLKDTTPTQLGSATYLKLRHHESGISTKVLRSTMPQLTKKLIKYLLNNDDVNESLGYPFHPELRD